MRDGVAAARRAGGRRRPPPGAARGGTRSRRSAGRRPIDPVTSTWLPTAVRRASSRSASSIAATRARRSWSTRRPATAATPMTAWAGSGRATMRASRTSRRVGGRRPPAASSPAPSSSSTKNGLPSERRWIWSARSPVGGAPRMASSSSAGLGRSSRRRSSRSTRPLRSSSASHGSSGWRRCSSSARKVMTSTTRSVREVADQEGDRLAGRRIGPVEVLDDEQDGRDLRQPLEHAQHGVEQPGLVRFGLRSPSSRRRPGSSDGTRRARSGLRRPERPPRARRRRARGPASGSASTIGPYGTPPSPMSAQPPSSTRIPRAAAIAVRRADQARLADAGLAGDELVDRARRPRRCRGRGRWRRAPSPVPRASG